MPTFKIKLPDESEVTFSHRIESDCDVPIHGNASASGNDEHDREAEKWIENQLRRGNAAAWCGFIVTAEWQGFSASASLWACSYESEEALLADLLVEWKHEAFLALCTKVETGFAKLVPLIRAEPDAFDEAHTKLVDAIQRVAEAGREVADGAHQPWGDAWYVNVDELNDLREAIKGWTDESNALLAAQDPTGDR